MKNYLRTFAVVAGLALAMPMLAQRGMSPSITNGTLILATFLCLRSQDKDTRLRVTSTGSQLRTRKKKGAAKAPFSFSEWWAVVVSNH